MKSTWLPGIITGINFVLFRNVKGNREHKVTKKCFNRIIVLLVKFVVSFALLKTYLVE